MLNGLEKYNHSKNSYLHPNIYKKEKECFGFYVCDNEEILGEACGEIDYEHWVNLELLYLNEDYRGYNIRTDLYSLVNEFAEENKCLVILVETCSFQAKGFYQKM